MIGYIILRYVTLFLLTLLFLSSWFITFATEVFNTLVLFFFGFFVSTSLEQGILMVGDSFFHVIRACIAPSMYVFMTIIFFATPLSPKMLLTRWFYGIVLFTLFNIVRIFVLIGIDIFFGDWAFQAFHLFFYQILNVVGFLLIVHFIAGPLFLQNLIPFYTDMKRLVMRHKI